MLELLKEVRDYMESQDPGLWTEEDVELYEKIENKINEIEDYKDISERLERAKTEPGTELGEYLKELYEE